MWKPEDFAAELADIRLKYSESLPPVTDAKRAVKELENQLLDITGVNIALEFNINLSPFLILGFGKFDNSRLRGFYIDTGAVRESIEESQHFWMAYNAMPLLINAIRNQLNERIP